MMDIGGFDTIFYSGKSLSMIANDIINALVSLFHHNDMEVSLEFTDTSKLENYPINNLNKAVFVETNPPTQMSLYIKNSEDINSGFLTQIYFESKINIYYSIFVKEQFSPKHPLGVQSPEPYEAVLCSPVLSEITLVTKNDPTSDRLSGVMLMIVRDACLRAKSVE